MTVAREATFTREPGACTVMVTLSGLLESCPSLTTSWKVSVVAEAGAVKVGRAAVELLSERICEPTGAKSTRIFSLDFVPGASLRQIRTQVPEYS